VQPFGPRRASENYRLAYILPVRYHDNVVDHPFALAPMETIGAFSFCRFEQSGLALQRQNGTVMWGNGCRGSCHDNRSISRRQFQN
jgi:hypothetical protein